MLYGATVDMPWTWLVRPFTESKISTGRLYCLIVWKVNALFIVFPGQGVLYQTDAIARGCLRETWTTFHLDKILAAHYHTHRSRGAHETGSKRSFSPVLFTFS